MKDGFSVELKVENNILVFDENTGLLSCSIPRQMREDSSMLTMGIVSQQANVKIYDFDMRIYRTVIEHCKIGDVKMSIYYNDQQIFIGFVYSSDYNEDATLEISIADPLMLLTEDRFYSNPYISQHFSVSEIKTQLFDQIVKSIGRYGIVTSVVEVSDTYTLPDVELVLPEERADYDDVSIIPYAPLWSVAQSFANFTLSCIYWTNGTIYVRRVV